MRILAWSLFAALLFAAAVVAGFPASLAWQWGRPQDLPLELIDVRGSVWHGGAAQVRWREHPLGALTWNADPAALLTGRIAIAWQLDGPAAMRGRWLGGLGTTRFQDIAVDLPAPWLIGPALTGALSASGSIHIAIPEIIVEGHQVTALSGRLLWRDATLRGLTVLPLGRLHAPFALADGQQVQGTIQDEGGPISIQGQFTADRSHYRIDLTLAARDRHTRSVIGLLGQPLPDGRRRLLVEQRLSMPNAGR